MLFSVHKYQRPALILVACNPFVVVEINAGNCRERSRRQRDTASGGRGAAAAVESFRTRTRMAPWEQGSALIAITIPCWEGVQEGGVTIPAKLWIRPAACVASWRSYDDYVPLLG